MTTADLIESLRADIRQGLREEILAELQPEIDRRLYSNIFDSSEACRYLKISEASLRRMVRDKEIPFFRQRGNLYFRQASLNEWILKKEQKGAPS